MMKKFWLTYFLVLLMVPPSHANLIKKPNVAGQFYDANPARLTAEIDQMMKAAPIAPTEKAVEVLISPHAGYVYSGPVAAYAYKAVSRRPVKTVVLLAPSHYFGFDGISVWQSGSFETPLGAISVDETFAKALLAKNKKFIFEPRAFDREHSLEVELPFLQRTFSDFQIVPVIVGQTSFDLNGQLAQALDEIIGTRQDVLIVVSSDMSHFHDAAFAEAMDAKSIEAIRRLDAEGFWQGCESGAMEMCGSHPVTAAILYARRRGLTPEFLKYAHSGNATGDMTRVVGYTSFIFYKKPAEPTSEKSGEEKKPVRVMNDGGGKMPESKGDATGVAPLSVEQKKKLMGIATQTVQAFVKTGKVLEVNEADPRLVAKEGAFVTIRKNGQLRGCIGHIIGQEPLFLTVRDMAVAAASEDHRFTPVTPDELGKIDVEISVLSQPRPARSVDEIKMGVHGVIVRQGPFNQGVFLPQVADETGWSREEFLSQLCSQKAGLAPDCWKDPRTRLDIFTADVFSEKDLQ